MNSETIRASNLANDAIYKLEQAYQEEIADMKNEIAELTRDNERLNKLIEKLEEPAP